MNICTKIYLEGKKRVKNCSIFKIERQKQDHYCYFWKYETSAQITCIIWWGIPPTFVNSSTWLFPSALCVLRTEAPPSFDLHAFWEQSSFWPSIIVVPSGLTTTDSWSCCWDDWRIIAIRVFWPCLSIFTETWWARRVESSINFWINFDTNSLSRT